MGTYWQIVFFLRNGPKDGNAVADVDWTTNQQAQGDDLSLEDQQKRK